MQAERELGMAFGLDAWINKPIDLSTLYDSLRRACAGEVDSSTPPAISWPGSIYLNQELLVLFREAMSSDLPKAWDALSNRDSEALISVLHRIRGALAVMKVEEMAIFSEMLELKVSADGLTPALENAARSMLRELETLLGGFI
ncbi:Sensor protein EvgS precursor [compost metagenome]